MAAPPLASALGASATRGGRVTVTPTLQLDDDPDVYVIGDRARWPPAARLILHADAPARDADGPRLDASA